MENMSDHDLLTQNRQMANVAVMSNEPEGDDKPPKVKPIMIYPQSAEQRALFKAAADRENRKLSPFIVHVLNDYLRRERRRNREVSEIENEPVQQSA